MTKIDPYDLNEVSHTLFITLACRAVETAEKKGILKDPKALEIAEKVSYDLSAFKDLTHNILSVCNRAKKIDEISGHFLQNHHNGIIISIGSGLDTRFNRIDNGSLIMYELDLPSVIKVREKFIPPAIRNPYLPFSAFDYHWMNKLSHHKDDPILFIAEGFALYQPLDKFKALVKQIMEFFTHPDNLIVFDTCSKYQKQNVHKHPAVNKTKARFEWGIDDHYQIEQWDPEIKLLDKYYYARPFFWRLGLSNFKRLLPKIGKGYALLIVGRK